MNSRPARRGFGVIAEGIGTFRAVKKRSQDEKTRASSAPGGAGWGWSLCCSGAAFQGLRPAGKVIRGCLKSSGEPSTAIVVVAWFQCLGFGLLGGPAYGMGEKRGGRSAGESVSPGEKKVTQKIGKTVSKTRI